MDPTEYELMELYRSWWKDSYGTEPNNQATVIAAAWARHALNVCANAAESAVVEIVDDYMQLQAQQGSSQCVYHPARQQDHE